jgi:hypothetical protein
MTVKGESTDPLFAVEPSLWERIQAAPGLIPVILNIRPADDLTRLFSAISI